MIIDRKDFLLLVLGILSDYGRKLVKSRTKLMKIIYLLEREKGEIIKKVTGMKEPYRFEWYLFGPFSVEVLNDLDELSRIGYIKVIPEETEYYIQHNYMLTTRGLKKLDEITEKINGNYISELKSYLNKFKYVSASQIKKLVYKKYRSYELH